MNVIYPSNTTTDLTRIDFTLGSIGISTGVFFVRRIFPVKINAGVFANLGYEWLTSTMDSSD